MGSHSHPRDGALNMEEQPPAIRSAHAKLFGFAIDQRDVAALSGLFDGLVQTRS
jgi:hypothetical protein